MIVGAAVAGVAVAVLLVYVVGTARPDDLTSVGAALWTAQALVAGLMSCAFVAGTLAAALQRGHLRLAAGCLAGFAAFVPAGTLWLVVSGPADLTTRDIVSGVFVFFLPAAALAPLGALFGVGLRALVVGRRRIVRP